MTPATGISPYYERDGVAIYHDDCRRVLPSLSAESVDFVLTDPPHRELPRQVGRRPKDHRR